MKYATYYQEYGVGRALWTVSGVTEILPCGGGDLQCLANYFNEPVTRQFGWPSDGEVYYPKLACTIESAHFTKNGSSNFTCNAVLPNDKLDIEVVVSGIGSVIVVAEYDSPYMTGDSVPSGSWVLVNGSKTFVLPFYSPGGEPYKVGKYRLRAVYVYDESVGMGSPVCKQVY